MLDGAAPGKLFRLVGPDSEMCVRHSNEVLAAFGPSALTTWFAQTVRHAWMMKSRARKKEMKPLAHWLRI